MPKQVFIESRNQTLEFPDEATQDQINDAVTAMFPPTGKDMADYVEGVKNAAMEGQDLVDPFQQMSDDNYVLFKQYQADKKTSPGEFFGIAKDTFNQVRDELATGIGTAAYKTYQGEGVEVAKSLGEGMQAGMIGTYDILNKIFDPAQPIPRKEDFVGKVAKPNYASNAFMGMGGMIPNAVGQDRVNTEEDYNNLIASEKQRDSEIVNRLYAMESTMRNASIPEVARGGQFVDPFLAAGLGGALVKVALKGGKTLITKAAASAAARAAGTEGVETAAEAAARTAGTVADNIPTPTGPTPTTVIDTIESGGMRPFTPDPNAPMGAFASTAPSPMAQAGLRAAETTAGAVQFTAGLPSQALKKLGELTETVLPGMGASAQAVPLVGAAMSDLGLTAGVVAGTKTTEKIAELLRSFARVSQQEASRAGAFERIALDPLTSAPVRKAAAGLAQFQPIARTVIDLSKGALKGGAAGSVVGAGLGGLAERSLEGAASGFGAGLALGGFYGSLNAGFDIGKETFGGSTARTRRNASGDINRFIASRPELEQAGWIDAMRVLVEKIGPERAASQMDALRVAEASGVKLRIATPDENKLWKAPGWLDPDKGELVLNPPKLRADTPAHEATHAIFASNVKRQYRSQIEEAIYGIPDPVTGEIVKAGFLDDAALAKIAEQIRDSYKKGDQKIAADRFEGLANNLKNSTDKESLIKARSAIADEMAADYGGKFFARVKAGRFNPDRLPLVYRNAFNAIDDGIYNTFKSVVYERGMDLGFDNTTKSFRNANGKQIRSPQLDEIFKRAYSQKSTAETVVSKKPDLIPANPADRAIWAKTHGGARGILNEDNTPKSSAQVAAEATARWENMVNKLSPLPEGDKVGLNFSRDESGKTTMTAQGQLSPAALTAILESDMLDASANAVLRDVIISMQDPNKSTFDTRYYKVHERGKGKGKMVAGVYPPSHNEILPFKVTMNSKEGVNIHAVDMTKVRQRLATAMNKPQFKDLYSNPTDALKDFKKYLDNITQPGRPAKTSAELFGGETGAAKRNLFYDALGFKLSVGKSLLNVPDSIINKYTNTIKTYRVERFTKLVDTGFKFPFEEATTYYRGMENFQPAAFTPESLPNGESFTNPDGFRILNKTGSKLFRTYDDTGKLIGVAESKEKAVKKAMDEASKRMTKEQPANIRFQFAGEAAEMPKFMRDSLETAKAMAKEGKDSETIRAITGWFPGKYDDKMRWEVPDQQALIKTAVATDDGIYDGTLGGALAHQELFKAYPELKDLSVRITVDPSRTPSGRFARSSMNGQPLDSASQITATAPNYESAKSILLHEVQHWIQNKEGFARGSNPDEAGFSAKADEEFLKQNPRLRDIAERQAAIKARRSVLAERLKELGEERYKSPEAKEAGALDEEFSGLIQERGNIERGMREKIKYELYRRTAGEIESRDIQARQSFTPEQRKAIAPYSSENIAKDEAIVLKNANKPESSKRFQSVTPEQDAAYLQAVKAGDSEMAQRLVDDAAKALGNLYDENTTTKPDAVRGIPSGAVFHISKEPITEFKEKYKTDLSSMGFHFGTEAQAKFRGGQYDFNGSKPTVNRVLLKLKNPLRVSHMASYAPDWLAEKMINDGLLNEDNFLAWSDEQYMPTEQERGAYLVKQLKEQGYDGLVYANKKEGEGDSYVPFDPNQIKSADPVTYDNAGNVIPLSERFNPKSNDIRFQPSDNVPIVGKEGDSETIPLYQKKENGKLLFERDGTPKVVNYNYDLLNLDQLKRFKGPVQNKTLVSESQFDYDVGPKAIKAINDAIKSGAVDSLVNKTVRETLAMMEDPSIVAGKGWYSRMRVALKKVYGDFSETFAQLLGATSAQTPVDQNFLQAVEAAEMIKSGAYDNNRKQYLVMRQSMADGTIKQVIKDRGLIPKISIQVQKLQEILPQLTKKAEKESLAADIKSLSKLIDMPEDKWTNANMSDIFMLGEDIIPRRNNGRKYNANSKQVLAVIGGDWLRVVDAPKTPNFAGNLTGRTLQATIDVWAARFMRRMIYGGTDAPWRIQYDAEVGVTNKDFAFSQIVLERAAKKLNMNPDDLQAVLWFGEKDIYSKKNWTSAEGKKKASFDEMFNLFFPANEKPRTFSEVRDMLDKKKK